MSNFVMLRSIQIFKITIFILVDIFIGKYYKTLHTDLFYLFIMKIFFMQTKNLVLLTNHIYFLHYNKFVNRHKKYLALHVKGYH